MKFEQKVWKLLKKIPKGKVTTYGTIARKLNSKAYRAVGTACHNNPDPAVPCYRVVRSSGSIGICHVDSCHRKRISRLRKDGIKIKGNRILNLKKVLFKF
jgi:O-6-methylguanine DNA methyltransferase